MEDIQLNNMALLQYNNVEIKGISAVVPKQIIDNRYFTDFISEKEADSIIKMTGIAQRRFASKDVTSVDLCYQAAQNLVKNLDITMDSIDAIIMVTLTPDYRMPGSAFVLHQKLKLKKECLAFDISLGCSGYIYGLCVAFNLLQQENIGNILLLNGETKSKTYGKKDKSTSLLFGDAGSATIIGKTETDFPTTITLNSDGSRYKVIMIPSGGYRNPTNANSTIEQIQEDGNWRALEQGIMDGPAVFDFTITEVPVDIQIALKESDKSINDIDYFIFHQANKFITDHIGKKLGIPAKKIPYSLNKYGNTASVSIPLTISSELYSANKKPGLVCFSAFGVGLSWGTAITNLKNCLIEPVKEYDVNR